MTKRAQYLQRLASSFLTILTLTFIVPLPVSADSNKQLVKALKTAALNCQASAYQEFMPPDTFSKVNSFEEHMVLLDALTDSIFARCIRLFGPGTLRTPVGIQVPIAGRDPRWQELFGPQWESIVAANPEGPFYFKMNYFMEWDQECKVIQRFQACLEDEEFCSDFHIDGSVLRMTQKADTWQLVFDLPPEQEAQAEKIKTAIIRSAAWADNYLSKHGEAPASDDFKYQFARDYFSKMNALLGMLK
ncbi:MAG: hypothetical protein MI802_13585 [Desulfobacterales bacterium]|nr:hypothetical protein [Desulfobacterales bacterium]